MIDTNSAVAVVVVGVIALVPAVDTIRRWFAPTQRREIQQPLEVKPVAEWAPKVHAHEEYVTRLECQKEHAENSRQIGGLRVDISELRHDVKAGLEALGRDAEERARKLHARIDPIAQSLAAVNGRVDDHLADHRAGRN
jgi:predicted Holliday junction resolvase-like endonuclease